MAGRDPHSSLCFDGIEADDQPLIYHVRCHSKTGVGTRYKPVATRLNFQVCFILI